ncbi:MAG: hypothetical protein KDC53_19135, partial [Saprospiraceae bacterium]|nr:hypothetical protein [Saprospiraceae bacterium]
ARQGVKRSDSRSYNEYLRRSMVQKVARICHKNLWVCLLDLRASESLVEGRAWSPSWWASKIDEACPGHVEGCPNLKLFCLGIESPNEYSQF